MAQAANIKYRVFTSNGGRWTAKGTTQDRAAALSSAENLLDRSACDSVKVDQEFFDVEKRRNVTTTIFVQRQRSSRAQRGGGADIVLQVARWAALMVGTTGLGFGAVLAANAFLF